MEYDGFKLLKQNVLRSIDCSKKGCIDEDIIDIIQVLNECPHYVTTSSCSGRIVINGVDAHNPQNKINCKNLFSTHKIDGINVGNVETALSADIETVILKVEPFILHIACRNQLYAAELQNIARDSGYKNSGMTVNKKGKIMITIRSTLTLEVPLRLAGQLTIRTEVLPSVLEYANQKMVVNSIRLESLKTKIVDMIKRIQMSDVNCRTGNDYSS